MVASPKQMQQGPRASAIDWPSLLRQIAVSRALDDLEEFTLLQERKVLYQFSARGHELTQVLLAAQLTGARDGVGGYYRTAGIATAGTGVQLAAIACAEKPRADGVAETWHRRFAGRDGHTFDEQCAAGRWRFVGGGRFRSWRRCELHVERRRHLADEFEHSGGDWRGVGRAAGGFASASA